MNSTFDPACRRCPRLVDWRELVGTERRRSFADETYWARPVPGWGDPAAHLVVVGLAPAAQASSAQAPAMSTQPSASNE